MKPNTLKQKWAAGQPTLNGWLSIPNSFSAEVMAAQGFDSVTIDMQHGPIGYGDALVMLQALAAYDVTPVVRVPWLDPAAIMKAMDAGAFAIICPMINNRDQAEQLVSYMRYPPDGTRSFGPTRVAYGVGSNYAAEANEQIMCLAMIETAEAMSNLQEIVSTPGLDGIYIGPADLSLGMSNGRLSPGMDREEPEMVEAIQSILKAARGAGVGACLHCGSPEYAAKAIGWGFNLCTLNSDARFLEIAASASLKTARKLLSQSTQGSSTGGY